MDSGPVELIEALRNPAVWPDRPERVDLIETHISWVLLTREFAWKIKKPVSLGFVDFSTLELREHFCREELRLNRRTAPKLYLDVVPICGDASAPVVGGPGQPIEFAVQMRRFEESQLLSRMASEGRLGPSTIDALAEHIANFHRSAPKATRDSQYGHAQDILRMALDNFEVLTGFAENDAEFMGVARRLEYLQGWTRDEAARLAEVFERRRNGGFVRECHGDLHLRNIVDLETGPCLFDCLEFNDRFRWIDVISEIAFLIMDLQEHGAEPLARRFLNRYVECTDDHAGLALLRFHLVYRAMVRAKVDAIRLGEQVPTPAERRALVREIGGYLRVAERDATRGKPALIIMHGLSGSGKTNLSQQILESLGAIRIRSDIERKRSFGLDETARADGAEAARLYSPEATRRTYAELETRAARVIDAGFAAIVDATFLLADERARFRRLAEALGVPFCIVACTAPEAELLRRVAAREADGGDASDAGIAVLRRQLKADTGIDGEPASQRIRVDTTDEGAATAAIEALRQRLG